MLDYALLAFKKAMEINPSANYNIQIAAIYGEKADIENMFKTYLDLVETNVNYLPTAKKYANQFISKVIEDSKNQ